MSSMEIDVKRTMTRDYNTEILDVRVEGIPKWGIVSLICRVLNGAISQDVDYWFEKLDYQKKKHFRVLRVAPTHHSVPDSWWSLDWIEAPE